MAGSLSLRSVEVFDGDRILPGRHDVAIAGGRIEGLYPAGTREGPAGARELGGGAVLPGLVDAHVHVSFSSPEALVRGGVTGALDLGEPISVAFADHAPLRLRASGPLITAPGGYPTQSWGANGYGLEVDEPDAARNAVAMLASRGAAMIKVAITSAPSLDLVTLHAIVSEAGDRGLRVAAHALRETDVRTALTAGVSVLAHTPIEPLADDLVESLAANGVAIISTVRAFGGADATASNLSRLAEAGCEIVYGTDLGNDGIEPGADAAELSLLANALGGVEAALRSATSGAASLAGLPPAHIRAGELANLIVCESLDFESLRAPSLVMIDGKEIE